MCIDLVRHIGFSIHFISVAHCCPLVLIEDITQMWQDAFHIWKYYIIKSCLSFVHIMTGIRSFLQKWHYTVITLTDYLSHCLMGMIGSETLLLLASGWFLFPPFKEHWCHGLFIIYCLGGWNFSCQMVKTCSSESHFDEKKWLLPNIKLFLF